MVDILGGEIGGDSERVSQSEKDVAGESIGFWRWGSAEGWSNREEPGISGSRLGESELLSESVSFGTGGRVGWGCWAHKSVKQTNLTI